MVQHSSFLKLSLSNGASLAYNIFGLEQLQKGNLPLILVGGRSHIKTDWERLIPPLSQKRAVLAYDHRGIGDSTYSTPDKNDDSTIVSMARDLLALVEHVGWKDVNILGFSMGGVILQQLLLFPCHATEATPLPFRVHHALLTGTMCSPIQPRRVLPPPSIINAPASGQLMTTEQKNDLRRVVDASLGPKWVALPENKARYELWLERSLTGRPTRTLLKQGRALRMFSFREELINIPSSTKVLVIHGREDVVVPFSYAEEILRSIPHARMVEIGSQRGQVPNYDFGHVWYEYFEVDVWVRVIEEFVDTRDTFLTSRL
ncbi:Alpha/Beta hydrolase protein [Gautieria morchelliformis]|nr:Alpha/Beta hydrolase protein [Gautieria morchelliformis]